MVSFVIAVSWLTGYWHIFSVGPRLVPTALSAALLLTGVSAATLVLVRVPSLPFARRFAAAVGAVTMLAGGATLLRVWWPSIPVWDGPLVAAVSSEAPLPVGVMAPHAGGTFVLLGASLLCLLGPGRRLRPWETVGSALAILSMSNALVAVTAALFGGALVSGGYLPSMAVPTAILMGATASALLGYANPDGWMLAIFTRSRPGARFDRALAVAFLLFVLGITATGTVYFRREMVVLRNGQHRMLESVARMKANSLIAWRRERLADGASLAASPIYRLPSLRRAETAEVIQASVRYHLETFLQQYGYDSVEWHIGGVTRVVGQRGNEADNCEEVARVLRAGLAPGASVMTDAHRETPGRPLGIDVVAAIPVHSDAGERPVAGGYVVLHAARWANLLADLSSWPDFRESGQIVLLQAEPGQLRIVGGGVDFEINDVVPADHVFARLFHSAGHADSVVVADGLDARGEPTLAVAAVVPDTKWYVVAAIARGDIYALLSDRVWMGSVSLALTVLGVALGLTVIRRQREAGLMERELHERQIREEAEQSYRTLFREMQEGCALHEMVYNERGEPVDYRFLAVNPAFERLTGLRAAAIVGRTVLDVLPGTERHWIKTYGRVAQTGEEASFESYTEPLDKHFLVNAFRPAPGQFACVFHDITERKRAELAVAESEEKFSLAFQTSPYAITITRVSDGRFIDVNPAFSAITGFSRDEAVGSSSVGLRLWADAADRDRVIADLRNGLTVDGREGQFRKKNGELLTGLFSARGMVLRGDPCVLSSIQDITDRRRTQDLLIQTEKMMSVGGLAGGMAHELNNPLGVIRQAVENAERRLLSDLPANRETASRSGITLDALRTYLEQREIPLFLSDIRQATIRAGEIIGGMLRFARRSDSSKEPTNVGSLVERAIQLASNDATLREICDLRSIDLTTDIPQDLPLLFVAPTEIEQVLLNLLVNAGHAMAETASVRPPRLTVRAFMEHDACIIEVRDNGPGLDPDVARRVFEPFFTTKKTGSGTGLGLSVAYAIVTQNHDGQIWVDSVRGDGACFSVKLPLRPRTAVTGGPHGADHA